MKSYRKVLDINYPKRRGYINITPEVQKCLEESGIKEKLFLKTLEAGERRLKELVKTSMDGTISGEEAFKLYDTYGFPFELTLEYLNELGYTVSRDEFDKYMNIQKELAKKNSKNNSNLL